MRQITFFNLLIICFFIGCFYRPAFAQPSTKVRNLSLEEFYRQILAYHPVVRQANLMTEMGRQELRMARGGFDPKISFDYSRKEFKGTTYYNLVDSKLKVPTWIGDFEIGYNQYHGDFLNPERSQPDAAGQGFLGITVPLGQELIMDARRAVLRQAQFFQEIARADRIKEINKILLSAAKDYWEWYFTYHQYEYLDSAYALARQRYEGVVISIGLGETAPIDSVDAQSVVQNRNIERRQAEVELQNARIRVSNYLWGDNETPLVLADDLAPEDFLGLSGRPALPNREDLLNFSAQNHPEIIKLVNKLKQLAVEERLQQANLLPRLDLKYNLLRNIQNVDEQTNLNFQNNYQFGVNFEMPLFLRKERGKLNQVRIKQSQTDFELLQLRREILNEVEAAYNELLNSQTQIQLLDEITENFRILRDAEVRKYLNGESSLFLINAREAKLIESQIKLEKQKANFEKARATLLWTSGQPFWESLLP
ncbi:MAG: TolC family protein [Microscillaceae bacterium]